MELFTFKKGEVADWLQNCKTIIGERIKFARVARNVSVEKISAHLGICEDAYISIENGSYPLSEQLLTQILRSLLCSKAFLICESPWLLNEKSSRISKDDYRNSCIPHASLINRIEELILYDHINLNILKKQLTSAEHEGLNGTNNLIYIKKYASLLNCSWQYLAGLSPFRWSEDIACKSPKTQHAILNDTIINRVNSIL